MQFEVTSVGYNRDKAQMSAYKDELIRTGVNVVSFISPEEGDYSTYPCIVVDINSVQDFVKVTEAVGTVIFSGNSVLIYDDYYE